MTAEQKPSFASGPECGLGKFEGKRLVEAIAERVARAPEGRFWSLKRPEHPRSRTYQELWGRSGRIAAGLIARGLPRGCPIVLMLEDGLDFIPAYWACLRAGHVAVALSSAAVEARSGRGLRALAELLVTLAPRLTLADDDLGAIAAREVTSCPSAMLTDLEGDDVSVGPVPPMEQAYILATSGSAGNAKLVAISGSAVLYRAFTTGHVTAKDSGAAINTFPIDSTTGIFSANLGFRENIHLPMATLARDPTVLFNAVETYRASSLSITDTMAARVVEVVEESGRQWDLSSLRQVNMGAETVLPSTVRRLDEILRRFNARAVTIGAGYGTTETGTLLTGANLSEAELVDGPGVPLGTPAPNVAVRVVDSAGAVVPEGIIGEVEVHTPLKMFSFYLGDVEGTARSFTADGWWRTGDTGLLCDGQLKLQGRTKDVFIANGRKFALGAVDEAMRSVLSPQEAAFACTLPGRDGQAEVLAVALVVPPSRRAAAAALARQAVGRHLGLPVAVIRFVPSSAVPLTATGKVKRRDLAALLSGLEPDPDDGPTITEDDQLSAPVGSGLASIWEAILGRGSARDRHANYYALGGTSIRAIELFSRIELQTGVAVEPSLFFAKPTLAALMDLFEAPASFIRQKDRSVSETWPLSAKQYKKQLIFTSPWIGKRPTANRLVLAFNVAGSKPPIFLVCQQEHEVKHLAINLGPDQPIYGLRSGHYIIEHRDEEVQAFALRYVADIEILHPKGPILLVGNCQGAVMALAMAQHLLRRGRHVPLLALIEWPTNLHPYPGRVLFIYGEESHLANPYRKFREPERGWRRHHTEVETIAVSGDHWQLMRPRHSLKMAEILADRFARALRLPVFHLANEHRRVKISLGPLPSQVKVGETFAVRVNVTNASATPWAETTSSGLMLASRWTDANGMPIEARQGRAALPAIAPSATESVLLTVMAPPLDCRVKLVVDVVEEGSCWFGATSGSS